MLVEEHLAWEQTHPVDWLRVEYARRRKRNPSYSVRAFAKFLGMSSGGLSEILAKKRTLTILQGKKIAERLDFGPDETQRFLLLIRKKSPTQRAKGISVDEKSTDEDYRQLELDKFSILSDWHYFALLSLMETHDFVHDEKWMAIRLGISPVEVRSALECLQRLEMVKQVADKWIGTGQWATGHNISSLAGRKFERQGMQKALDALETVPIEERDVTSITMAIDPEKVTQAKDLIRQFRRDLAQFMETGNRREVYRLNVQLIPLSKRKDLS